MNLNFKAPINDYDGTSIKVSNAVKANPEQGIEAKDAEFMTLGSMAIQALNTVREQEADMSAEDKIHRATLSMLIFNAYKNGENDGIVDVDQKDIVLMKELMNSIFTPLPLMRAFNLFDPKVEDVSSKTETSA